MKKVVIGGTGLIDSKTVAICARVVTMSSQQHPIPTATRSLERGLKEAMVESATQRSKLCC